jgi:hypothetical protein
MQPIFFHEKRAKLIAKQQRELASFDAQEAEYNVLFDILVDVTSEFPDIYTSSYINYATISIPEHMTREQFYKWLDYLEAEYLSEYNMIRNDVVGSTINTEYVHGSTDGLIHIDFVISQCRTIEKMEYKKTYVADCHWE